MTQELKKIFGPLVEKILKIIACANFGIIEKYDKTKNLAHVKPLLSTTDLDTGTVKQLKPETKVPVIQLGNPKQRLRFPPQVGDPVILFYLDSSLEEWLESSGLVQLAVKSNRRHHTSHAIALYMGGAPQQWENSNQRPDLVEMISDIAKFWIGSETVNLITEVKDLGNSVKILIELLEGDVNYPGRASSSKLVHILPDLAIEKGVVDVTISNIESIEGT